MARMRSPNYPSLSVRQAIDMVAKIYRSERANVITRDDAAKAMGYTGLTGRSMTVLGALVHFDLLTKVGKGEVKVTKTAEDILHSITDAERDAAILKAAFAPQLFQAIHNRFPEGIPGEGTIKSFLIREGFSDVAVGPAITAFMETYREVENIRESESYCDGVRDAPDSPQEEGDGGLTSPPPPPPPPPHGGYRIMEGERVVFSEETGAEQYLKLVAAGPLDDSLLEALEDYIKRQRKRLGIQS